MNSTNKITATADKPLQKAARVAGLMYFLIILTSMLSMVFGPSKLIVEGNDTATFNNIISNELLFRIGTVYDLVMFVCVVILSLALYVILRTVSRNLALLALLWRLGEAILGCLSVLSSLIILLLIKGENYSVVFETEQLQTIVRVFLDMSSASISIVIVFLSLGTIINCYLFYISKYIPRILSAFGILSFLLMLIFAIVNIIIPIKAFMAFGAPAILFEIIIGIWLFIKGVKVQ